MADRTLTTPAGSRPLTFSYTPPTKWVSVRRAASWSRKDSRYGVQAARAANMDVLAYAGGLTPADALEGPRTTVFRDMRQLPELLRAQSRS